MNDETDYTMVNEQTKKLIVKVIDKEKELVRIQKHIKNARIKLYQHLMLEVDRSLSREQAEELAQNLIDSVQEKEG